MLRKVIFYAKASIILTLFYWYSRFTKCFGGLLLLVLFWGILCVLQDHNNRRVGFVGAVLKTTSSSEETSRPSRLHRRDTPHHLKNKRIASTVDKEKVASIIAQVFISFYLYILSNLSARVCFRALGNDAAWIISENGLLLSGDVIRFKLSSGIN